MYTKTRGFVISVPVALFHSIKVLVLRPKCGSFLDNATMPKQ